MFCNLLATTHLMHQFRCYLKAVNRKIKVNSNAALLRCLDSIYLYPYSQNEILFQLAVKFPDA